MKKDKLDLVLSITERALENLNETASHDITQFPNLVSKIIKKVYTNSLVGEISDVQPLTGPIGKIATVFSGYGGRPTTNMNLRTSILLHLESSDGFSVDDTISTATASGTIEYIENNYVLVKDITGTFTTGDSTTGIITNIIGTYSNRFYAAKVLKSYAGGSLSMEAVEPNQMDIEIKLSTIEAKARKMKAKISKEAISDMVAMYGLEITEDLLVNEFANEMIQEIDAEIISYLRSIATPDPDHVLKISLGMNSGLTDLANDLYQHIYNLGTRIAIDTKRKQNFFVIVDPKTLSLLQVSPLQMEPATNNENIYYKGKVGTLYDLYVDPFADDNYCIVGYTNGYGGIGDAGLIYAPYTNQIIETVEKDTGKSLFFNIVRYAYTVHPQDTGTGAADSIFFRTFNINMDDIINLTKWTV